MAVSLDLEKAVNIYQKASQQLTLQPYIDVYYGSHVQSGPGIRLLLQYTASTHRGIYFRSFIDVFTAI